MNLFQALRLLSIMLLIVGCRAACHAQQASRDEMEMRLTTRIDLHPGTTTAQKFAESLSEQTGIQIKMADFLAQRRLMVQLGGLSAASALDAIAALNDWVWYKTGPNQVLITRRKLRSAPQADTLTTVARAALPADLRTYLGVARPEEASGRPLITISKNNRNIQALAIRAAEIAETHLLATLNVDALARKPLSYSDLTADQRDNLLEFLIFSTLQKLDAVLKSDLAPYELDPATADLSLDDANTVRIETTSPDKLLTDCAMVVGLNPQFFPSRRNQ